MLKRQKTFLLQTEKQFQNSLLKFDINMREKRDPILMQQERELEKQYTYQLDIDIARFEGPGRRALHVDQQVKDLK